MKIALAQIDVKTGNPETNTNNMIKHINLAKEKNTDLIVFSEMCVGGYLLGDKYNDDYYCEWLMSFNDKILQATENIAVCFGNIFIDKQNEHWRPNKDGRTRKFNAAYLFQNKKTIFSKSPKLSFHKYAQNFPIQAKTLLPNYRFFDDQRYFTSLIDASLEAGVELKEFYQPFEIETPKGAVSIGIELCEDLWCRDYRMNGESINPTKMLIENGAEIIVNLSASPWTSGKHIARDNSIQYIIKNNIKHDVKMVPFIYVNNVGVQNNGKNFITFDGGSTVYGSNGKPKIISTKPFKEDMIFVDSEDINKKPNIRRKKTNVIAEKYQAIIEGLKHIGNFSKNPKWTIGLSGGVDSAVVAAMLVDAFGNDNLIAINMPSKHNSEKTKQAAKNIAKKLNIKYIETTIENVFNTATSEINNSGLPTATSLNLENEQARIRGSIILAGSAARTNSLFTCNGNKVEMALGYCSAYGDLNGAVAPIGDMLKIEIFQLAKHINKIHKKQIIPNKLIPDNLCRFGVNQIPSGPELKDNQVSAIKFGYHDFIVAAFLDYKKTSPEQILEWYLNGTLEKELSKYGMQKGIIKRWGLDDPKEFLRDIEWVCKQFHFAIWKRIQAPPIIITSKTAFGYDLRETQMAFIKSEKYKNLEEKINSKN